MSPLTFPIEWHGDPLDHQLSVRDVLQAWGPSNYYRFWDVLSAEERVKLMKFYYGEQWDPAITSTREQRYRPTLTINRIPAIVARAIGNSQSQNEVVTREHEIECAVILTARNADAQREYNYRISLRAECEALRVRPTLTGIVR